MTPTKRKLTAETLRQLPPEKVKAALVALGPARAEELKHDWSFWARDNQLVYRVVK